MRLAPSPTSGADGADVHFTDFKEGHHERLLIQCTVASYEPRLLGADALSCLKKKDHSKYEPQKIKNFQQ